jgi:hypothetical protein
MGQSAAKAGAAAARRMRAFRLAAKSEGRRTKRKSQRRFMVVKV